jgi:hypothetical protein
MNGETFARRVFTIAGIYGLIVLLPLYFLEGQLGARQPPAITHPEFYYGFTGVAVAWQFVFLVIGRDPVRYRALMLPAILEKAGFGVPALILLALGRLGGGVIGGAIADVMLGVLFVTSFARTRPAR